jgi:hypothetical protein
VVESQAIFLWFVIQNHVMVLARSFRPITFKPSALLSIWIHYKPFSVVNTIMTRIYGHHLAALVQEMCDNSSEISRRNSALSTNLGQRWFIRNHLIWKCCELKNRISKMWLKNTILTDNLLFHAKENYWAIFS